MEGFPLITLAIPMLGALSSSYKSTLPQWIVVIILTYIFFIYAVRANVEYDPLYALWVISFLGSFLISAAVLKRLASDPYRMLKHMAYAYIPLLMFFLIGMVSNANDETDLADDYHQRLITSKALLLLSMSCISWIVIYLM